MFRPIFRRNIKLAKSKRIMIWVHYIRKTNITLLGEILQPSSKHIRFLDGLPGLFCDPTDLLSFVVMPCSNGRSGMKQMLLSINIITPILLSLFNFGVGSFRNNSIAIRTITVRDLITLWYQHDNDIYAWMLCYSDRVVEIILICTRL